jgi:hypothetical protein
LLANQPNAEANDIRTLLTRQSIAPQLQQAVKDYQAVDPSARFTYLRGHVDSFSAHPKAFVPEYAQNILKDAELPTNPTAQPLEQTSIEPKGAEGNLAVARETLAGKNLGNNGPDDGGVTNDIVTDEDPHLAETEWYEQTGRNVAVPILRAFLLMHNDVFEVPQQQLENNLPNLELKRYGVGRHFRRAEFMQSVGKNMPVLDGKTIVLFDLNWNVINISRQLMTPQKIGLVKKPTISALNANMKALQSLGLTQETGRIVNSTLGIDPIQAVQAWQIQLVNIDKYAEYTVTLDGATGNVMNISDDTARFNDAQVKRWTYTDGDRTSPTQVLTTGVYTHDDNTLVHDFFYLVNDDRNDGGTGVCSETSPDSNSTPNAYGTTTSSEYVRPTRRGDRNFSLWLPRAPKGPYGEGHVYYWARKYMQWQKQALVDLGVLTLGNFNNYTKALIIVNSCDDDAGHYDANFPVSTMDDLGENLPTILLPERCREGNSICTQAQYQANSTNLYTFEGDGGYHFPGVIHHELNHFVLQDYFNVNNGKNCANQKENKYFQEGGLGRTLAQMYWHNHYNVGYKPENPDHTVDTNKLFRSDGTSGEIHDENDASSLNEIANFACGTDGGDPYSWGSVVHQPMWEIYHGQKVEGSIRVSMARPASDNGMIKSMYYAADLTSASSFPSRFELANKFMEFWELFSGAVSTTKEDWCEVWQHHGMDTFIDVNYCS